MAREEHQYGYYESSVGNRWIDIHQSVKICIETYLSKVLFKGDLSRVCYAQSDIAFRRRIELLDKGKSEDMELSPTTLQLPFLSFAQTSDWENDDRVASQQAGQMIHGEYDLNTFRKIRSHAVKSTYTAQVFFDRRDDVRLASQLLNWEANPTGPTLLYHDVEWKGGTLSIPIIISIEKINTSPDYQEKDWLEKRRIFPIEIEMTVRSYEVHFDNFDKVIFLPIKKYGYENEVFKPESDTLYLTDQVDLSFMVDKFQLDNDTSKIDIEQEDVVNLAKTRFEETEVTPEKLVELASKCPNDYAADILKGYLTDNTGVSLDYFRYNPTNNKNTPTQALIEYRISKSDYKYFEKIVLLVPGHGEMTSEKCENNCFVVTGLHPNSKYECKLLTYSINGDITTYNISFTTKEDPKDPAPTPSKINKIPGLVGMHL